MEQRERHGIIRFAGPAIAAQLRLMRNEFPGLHVYHTHADGL